MSLDDDDDAANRHLGEAHVWWNAIRSDELRFGERACDSASCSVRSMRHGRFWVKRPEAEKRIRIVFIF